MAPRVSKAQRARKFPAEPGEVRRHWKNLDARQRLLAMTFKDPMLVQQIRGALHALYEKEAVMKQLGISGGVFAEGSVFMDVFAVPMRIGRCAHDPNIMVLDPDDQPDEMHVKEPLLKDDALLATFDAILPDFLGERTGRRPMARAHWKSLWAKDPASMAAVDRQSALLVEQALWAAMVDPRLRLEAPSLCTCEPQSEVPLQPWMLESTKKATTTRTKGKAGKGKKKSKRSSRVVSNTSGVTVGQSSPVSLSDDQSVAADTEVSDSDDPCMDDNEKLSSPSAGSNVLALAMHAPPVDDSPEMASLGDAKCEYVSTSVSLASLSESGPSDSECGGLREEDLLEADSKDCFGTTNNATENVLAFDLAACSPPGLTLCQGPLFARQQSLSTTGSEGDDIEDDASEDSFDAGSVACGQAWSGPHKVTPAFRVSSTSSLLDPAAPCFVHRAHGFPLYLWQ